MRGFFLPDESAQDLPQAVHQGGKTAPTGAPEILPKCETQPEFPEEEKPRGDSPREDLRYENGLSPQVLDCDRQIPRSRPCRRPEYPEHDPGSLVHMGLTCSVCGHYENVDLNAEKNYRKGRADPVRLFGGFLFRTGGLNDQAVRSIPVFRRGDGRKEVHSWTEVMMSTGFCSREHSSGNTDFLIA